MSLHRGDMHHQAKQCTADTRKAPNAKTVDLRDSA